MFTPQVTASITPAPVLSTGEGPTLWFVRDGALSPARSDVPRDADAATILAALADPPSTHGGAEGDRTLLVDPGSGEPMLVSTPATHSTSPALTDTRVVTVALQEPFFALPASDQVLLLGQAVLSLTDAGFRAVQFTDALGSELAVPLPNGRLMTGPVMGADFRGLSSDASV